MLSDNTTVNKEPVLRIRTSLAIKGFRLYWRGTRRNRVVSPPFLATLTADELIFLSWNNKEFWIVKHQGAW